jgi:Protein of unknown function (DUF1778)
MGTTMAGFVRAAAKEKAQVLLNREARITLTQRDFSSFAKALGSAFSPNPALSQLAEQHRRRGISSVDVLTESAQPERILGDYALSAAEVDAKQQVAAYAFLVDAKDDAAKAFYLHFGFNTLLDAPLTLYLPLGR